MGIRTEQREPTKSAECDSCGFEVRFYHYSGMGDLAPHFYCDTCSNVYFRVADRELVKELGETLEALEQIVARLPQCPCGGQFVVGSNPKCPNCARKFPYEGDSLIRLGDPYAIQIEGAVLLVEDDS